MLRDKYNFKMGQRSIEMLEYSIKTSMYDNMHTTDSICCLCLLTLAPFCNRLSKALLNQSYRHKFHIKRSEAIALKIAYTRGFIDSRDILIQQIFTTIDRTL